MITENCHPLHHEISTLVSRSLARDNTTIEPFALRPLRTVMLSLAVALLTACASGEKITDQPTPATIIVPQSQPYHHSPMVVSQSGSSEQQILTRLVDAIEELEALIREAEFHVIPDARLRFDYYQLRTDLLSIVQGIQAHIKTPVYAPRNLAPIIGNYGR